MQTQQIAPIVEHAAVVDRRAAVAASRRAEQAGQFSNVGPLNVIAQS